MVHLIISATASPPERRIGETTMQQSPFFHRIHEFCEPTSAFDEATRQIEAEHLGTTWQIWSFLTGPRGGMFAADIAMETIRGRTLEAAVARTIARWRRWTVNAALAAEMGVRAGSDFLTAGIMEAQMKGNAA